MGRERCLEHFEDNSKINMLSISFDRQWMDRMSEDQQKGDIDRESGTEDEGKMMEMPDSRGHGERQ